MTKRLIDDHKPKEALELHRATKIAIQNCERMKRIAETASNSIGVRDITNML